MNCNECENLTPDYLGDELDTESRHTFESHLNTCTDCAHRVTELSETAGVLKQLETVSHQEAEDRTSQLRIVRRRPLVTRTAFTLLKTAAVLALGVWLGRSSVDHPIVESNDAPGTESIVVAKAESLHPGWLKLARDMGPQRSTLAGQLAILSKSGR